MGADNISGSRNPNGNVPEILEEFKYKELGNNMSGSS